MSSQLAQMFGLGLFLVATSLLLASTQAQMTFSDGWGKRSSAAGAGSPFALLQHGNNNKRQSSEFGRGNNSPVSELFMGDEDPLNPAMEACHVGYAQRLVQLHEQMLALYSTYQQCQAKALLAGPKKASQKA